MSSPVLFVSLRADNERNSVLQKVKRMTGQLLDKRLKSGDLVAVKLHFGERGNHGFIQPVFLRYIIEEVKERGGSLFSPIPTLFIPAFVIMRLIILKLQHFMDSIMQPFQLPSSLLMVFGEVIFLKLKLIKNILKKLRSLRRSMKLIFYWSLPT